MNINDQHESSPMLLKISFNKLLERYEALAESEDEFIAAKANRILKTASKHPELRDGFEDVNLLDKYKDEISVILQDSFSEVLTLNEIKTASVPFHDLIFNSSERFKKIVKTAGDDFELKIINMPEDSRYIIACTIILQFCYGYSLNFKRPFFYRIPDANGINRFYKILYNADFTEIEITDKAPKITQKDFDRLLDNFDDLELWKEKFPPDSYIFKGFVIANLFDVTDDQSISSIKANLISEEKRKDPRFMEDFQETFQSLLNIKDLNVGFSIYNKENGAFEQVYGNGIKSFLLHNEDQKDCESSLCSWSYNQLLMEKQFVSVSDVDKYYKLSKGKAPHLKALIEQGIKSAIFAPIANEQELLAVMELVSYQPKVLNSIIANKLVDVMPYIVMAVERSKKEEENLIEAVIQKECTSIHPSVRWRFEREARLFIREQQKGNHVPFRKIAFDHVFPLYGQIDISGSSRARNKATCMDLEHQLKAAKAIFEKVNTQENLPVYDQLIFRIDTYLEGLSEHFQVDSEQQISRFFRHDITPIFNHLLKSGKLTEDIEHYFDTIDDSLGILYKYRKHYDDSVMTVNKQMAEMLDEKQIEAQRMYPHFFERFKTDGVEHNMYIGESITREENFNPIYLYNLRLWQLQVMCEMENQFYQKQHELPTPLDVASMILVFNQPLTISFRMDEKQFDVDGTYNARYEIVKKRVDKAYVKGTTERVTQKGKISIVYSQREDEYEYLRYIEFLQSKNYLDDDVEIVELEDLQAVTGLKAIRVSVLYHKNKDDKEFYTYNDLIKELKA